MLFILESDNILNILCHLFQGGLSTNDVKQTDNSSSNNSECKNQSFDVTNTNTPAAKSKRRSASIKHSDDGVEKQANIQSTISQRPRRHVKHKFIKSSNVNVIGSNTNSANSNDVSVNDESTLLLSSLSPNKMRLVPMIHRLPMNASKINWQDMIGNNPTNEEIKEPHADVVTVPKSETIDECVKMEKNDKLNDCNEVASISKQVEHGCADIGISNDNNIANNEETGTDNTVAENNLTNGKKLNSFTNAVILSSDFGFKNYTLDSKKYYEQLEI